MEYVYYLYNSQCQLQHKHFFFITHIIIPHEYFIGRRDHGCGGTNKTTCHRIELLFTAQNIFMSNILIAYNAFFTGHIL